jgi:hypothetical protein
VFLVIPEDWGVSQITALYFQTLAFWTNKFSDTPTINTVSTRDSIDWSTQKGDSCPESILLYEPMF